MRGRIAATLLIATAAAVGLAGCLPFQSPGETRTEEREIGDASEVVLRTSGSLDIRIGSEPSLTIEAGENVLKRLTSEVDDGVLVLDSKPGAFMFGAPEIDYELTVTSLQAVTIEGSADVSAEFGGFREVRVQIDGSGDIEATGIDADAVHAGIAGSGSIELTGSTDQFDVDVSGSGDIDAADLRSNSATVVVSGSGKVEVDASDTLDATVSGSGTIVYSGRPEVRSSVSGSGEVRPG
jgi:hypothetical protein